MDWLNLAVCRSEDADLFFSHSKRGTPPAQVAEAKAICGRCPVAAVCLQWALRTDQRLGIWGGLTESERRQLKARLRRARRTCEDD